MAENHERKELSTLTIQWKFCDSSLSPRNWHRWDALSVQPHRLDAQLNWPDKTYGYLQAALELNLSRSCAWDLGALNRDEQAAAKTAAASYLRGVQTNGGCEGAENGSYAIRCDEGRKDIGALGEFLVVDSNLNLPGDFIFYASEAAKSLESVSQILQSWHKSGTPQHWVIVGGGITGDVGAYAAHLAGASYEFVPTTLLAMVDACVGGKVGVNAKGYGKNLIGAFSFPQGVHIWSDWLDTLPDEELRSGGAECFKHALLAGDQDLLRRTVQALATCDRKRIANDLPQWIAVKADIVQRDPAEQGERQHLNLGHTLGHALEGLSQKRGTDILRHGEAVACGMVFALLLGEELGKVKAEKHLTDLRQAGILPNRKRLLSTLGPWSDATWGHLLTFIARDKKQRDGTSRWIVLKDFGKPEVVSVDLPTLASIRKPFENQFSV